MGISQSSSEAVDISYICEDCHLPFIRSGTQRLRTVKCDLCSDRQQQRGNSALVCASCRKIFKNEIGYLSPQDRLNVRCDECGDMMRGHMRDMNYKSVEINNKACIYPETLEECVKNEMMKANKNASTRGLPSGENK